MPKRPRYTPGQELSDEEKREATVRAQRLVDEGWYQVSRKYRHVARLPEGKTAKQALLEYELATVEGRTPESTDLSDEMREYWRKEKTRWVEMIGEGGAGGQFLSSFHAKRYHCGGEANGVLTALDLELDPFTFNEFRRLGGSTFREHEFITDDDCTCS